MTDVRGIIIDFLKANGYDGLAGEDCGCGLDDLIACDGECAECRPAYEWRCSPGCPKLADEGYCEFEDADGRCFRAARQAEAVAP